MGDICGIICLPTGCECGCGGADGGGGLLDSDGGSGEDSFATPVLSCCCYRRIDSKVVRGKDNIKPKKHPQLCFIPIVMEGRPK